MNEYCFNNYYNNLNSRQRSQTLQPIRGHPDKDFMLKKYFNSQLCSDMPYINERAKYANVPPTVPQTIDPEMVPPAMHFHTRSHSQHYYHQANNYYNLSGLEANMLVPKNQCIEIAHEHSPQFESINTLRLFEVCNELFSIDTAPPIPPRRNYTICGTSERGLFKLSIPPCRFTKNTN